MRISSAIRSLLCTGVALVIVACFDAGPTAPVSAPDAPASPTAPDVTEVSTHKSLLGETVSTLDDAVTTVSSTATTVTTVNRFQPLDENITVTSTIGLAGGVIEIPEAGFRLVVPAGAVRKNTTFTVTALAGRVLAYEFSPKGAKFKSSLTFDQSLRATDGFLKGLLGLNCSYFKDASLIDQLNGTALVSEVIPGTIDIIEQRVRCDIDHFSGYLVSAD